MKTKSYTLVDPIEWDSETGTIKKLNLRAPKVKDLKGLNLKTLGEDPDQMVTLLGRLADTEQAIIGELSLRDMNKLSELVSDFL